MLTAPQERLGKWTKSLKTTTCKKYPDLQDSFNCPKQELWESSQSAPPRIPHKLAVAMHGWMQSTEKADDCAGSPPTYQLWPAPTKGPNVVLFLPSGDAPTVEVCDLLCCSKEHA